MISLYILPQSFYSRTKLYLNPQNTCQFIIIYYHLCSNMTKYSKVYLRNKKQSNISLPLRYSFLSSIFVDQMSVKNAALKWKIHYSSAKIIARMAKRSNLQSIFKKDGKATACCSWKEVNSDNKSCPSESCQREMSVAESTQNCLVKNIVLVHPKKIQVISTIGWSYLKGIPLQSA